jgi:hypothetical protein
VNTNFDNYYTYKSIKSRTNTVNIWIDHDFGRIALCYMILSKVTMILDFDVFGSMVVKIDFA